MHKIKNFRKIKGESCKNYIKRKNARRKVGVGASGSARQPHSSAFTFFFLQEFLFAKVIVGN